MGWSVTLQQYPYLPIAASAIIIFITCLYYWYASGNEEGKLLEVKETEDEFENHEDARHLNEIAFCAAKLDAFDGKIIKNPLLDYGNFDNQLRKNDSMLVNVPSDLEEDEQALISELTAEDIILDNNESIASSNLGSEDMAEIIKELSENKEDLSTESWKKHMNEATENNKTSALDSTVKEMVRETICEALFETAEEIDVAMQQNTIELAENIMDDLAQGDAVAIATEKNNGSTTTSSYIQQKPYDEVLNKMSTDEKERERRIQQEQLRKVVEVMQSNPKLFQSSNEEDVNTQFSLYK